MTDVFISYAASDAERPYLIEYLVEQLENSGIVVWYEPLTGTKTNPEIQKQSRKALESSKLILFFWTAKTKISDWVASEHRLQSLRKRRIVALDVRAEFPPSDLKEAEAYEFNTDDLTTLDSVADTVWNIVFNPSADAVEASVKCEGSNAQDDEQALQLPEECAGGAYWDIRAWVRKLDASITLPTGVPVTQAVLISTVDDAPLVYDNAGDTCVVPVPLSFHERGALDQEVFPSLSGSREEQFVSERSERASVLEETKNIVSTPLEEGVLIRKLLAEVMAHIRQLQAKFRHVINGDAADFPATHFVASRSRKTTSGVLLIKGPALLAGAAMGAALLIGINYTRVSQPSPNGAGIDVFAFQTDEKGDAVPVHDNFNPYQGLSVNIFASPEEISSAQGNINAALYYNGESGVAASAPYHSGYRSAVLSELDTEKNVKITPVLNAEKFLARPARRITELGYGYPSEAISAGFMGDVSARVDFLITAHGDVSDITVSELSYTGEFEEVFLNEFVIAVQNTKWIPQIENGEAVNMRGHYNLKLSVQ